MVAFELKLAENGEALAVLDSRGVRQLRHFADFADQVYLVTVGAPRAFSLSPDGRVVVGEPVEAQPLPDGVGWVVFDQVGQVATVVKPAGEGRPTRDGRSFVVDHLLSRLGKMQRAIQESRK